MFPRQLRSPDSTFFLFGPRGTGKTTWIKQRFPDTPRYDLLRSTERIRLSGNPGAFGDECDAVPRRDWVVLDEVQKVPALLDEVQRLIVDRSQRFVLCGSSARKLRRGGANLLAGRAEVRHLFPFVSIEIDDQRNLEEILRHGMLPLAVQSDRPRSFLKAYVQTYLNEEIQAEALVRQIGGFARFLEVAARVNGQSVNVSSVSRDAAVARQTVQGYFQILVDTLLGYWLPTWKLKRSVKQVMLPKFYLFDSGVARELAGLGHLQVHPEERGFLLETYLLHEVRAYLHYRELDYPMFYWRTHEGTEVDLVVETPQGIVALEIKSADRWERRFGNGLQRFRRELEDRPVELLGVFLGE
ncbi:MAG: DUF4143 domain-containing protein, partial [Planctomycetota bacterium]